MAKIKKLGKNTYGAHMMSSYEGEMIQENLSAQGNMPMEIVRKMYEKDQGMTYDYEGNAHAMQEQEMMDIRKGMGEKAKRRY
jgi:hypothetical protein